jgi:hypothetical protein
MTGTKSSPTVPNLPSNDEITRFDGIRLGSHMLRNLVWQYLDFVYDKGLVRLAELSSFLILTLLSNLARVGCLLKYC